MKVINPYVFVFERNTHKEISNGILGYKLARYISLSRFIAVSLYNRGGQLAEVTVRFDMYKK